PDGHVVHASSEGQASVIAVNLDDWIDLIVTYPYWGNIISHDLREMRAAVVEAEEAALEEQPQLETWRAVLRIAFGIPGESAGARIARAKLSDRCATISCGTSCGKTARNCSARISPNCG